VTEDDEKTVLNARARYHIRKRAEIEDKDGL
jgi:hypothetical protein